MDEIRDYLVLNKNMSDVILEKTLTKLNKHMDIVDEFKKWIKTQKYEIDNPICIEGYTAKDIYNLAPFLDGLGVFNFLITLRENPDRAKAEIAAGFPRK